jgi:mRNA-degrading endonuclease RelE of RelBE toxin-antitoxin system
MAFEIEYADIIREHLQFIDRKHHAAIRDAIVTHLQYQPIEETKNRKPLDPHIDQATWELRCGLQNRYRVLYDVKLEIVEEEFSLVRILAIGEKRGEKLYIAGKEVL